MKRIITLTDSTDNGGLHINPRAIVYYYAEGDVTYVFFTKDWYVSVKETVNQIDNIIEAS